MNESNDKEIKLLIKNNPSLGISKALDLYGGAVKTIVKSILYGFSDEDIEETISDTFTSLWISIDKFDIERNIGLKTYLYGIARRTALNKKRSLANKIVNLDIKEIDIKCDGDLENEVEQKIDIEIIKDLIGKMKNPDKEVFVFRYFFQKKIKEISDDLNLNPKKVENILFRGKEKLKKQFLERSTL